MMNNSSQREGEIVLLVHKESIEPRQESFGARTIYFGDTPVLLSMFEASPFLSSPHKDLQNTGSDVRPVLDGDIRASEPLQQMMQEEPQGVPENRVIEPSQLVNSFTEAEIDAARQIENAYHRYRRRRTALSKGDPLSHWYNICRNQGLSPGCSRFYRFVYFGPFPQFLLCLHAFQEDIARQRAVLSHSLQFGDHLDLENNIEEIGGLE
jgi:hypothetical protein